MTRTLTAQPKQKRASGDGVAFPEVHSFAEAAYQSGLFKNIQSIHQAVVKIAMGRELGITPMRAMQSIYFVQGNITMNGTLIGALIRQNGRYDYLVTEHSSERCAIEFYARTGSTDTRKIGTSIFTLDDARRANLVGKDNWRMYPRNMLFNRAISNGARWYCPDVFLGAVYTPDEFDVTVNADGEPVSAVIAPDSQRVTVQVPEAARETNASADAAGHAEDAVGTAPAAVTKRYADAPSRPSALVESARLLKDRLSGEERAMLRIRWLSPMVSDEQLQATLTALLERHGIDTLGDEQGDEIAELHANHEEMSANTGEASREAGGRHG